MEERLGLDLDEFEKHALSVTEMLAGAGSTSKGLGETELEVVKEQVFNNIIGFIEIEGYPVDSPDFKEANVNDLVFTILCPILLAFQSTTNRKLHLLREKEIISTDAKTEGFQEFACINKIETGDEKFVFVIEAKKANLLGGKIQCMLSLKDTSDNNRDGGVLYGFVTTGEEWQMIRYDGKEFVQADPFKVALRDMALKKETWWKKSAIIVDCINTALKCGGSGE